MALKSLYSKMLDTFVSYPLSPSTKALTFVIIESIGVKSLVLLVMLAKLLY
jgi:hypothetical protein